MKKRSIEEESAIALVEAGEQVVENEEILDKKQSRQSLIKTLTGAVDTAKNVGNIATEVYNDWIKPIRDNWPQIKRRMSIITTIISIVFFVLYVPFMLFSKLTKGLSVGWDIALYVCMGVYVSTIVALLIVSLASRNSNTVAKEKKRKTASKIILLIVRLASLAIGITALIISAMEGASDSNTAVIDTVAIIFATASIIFSAFPLIFGGIGGFAKWLISPAKIKFKFSFVILEWYQSFSDEQRLDKTMKKIAKKYGERIGGCIDAYFLPAIGNKYIKSVDEHAIAKMLEFVPLEDLNMCEWITKRVFEFADDCNYIDVNPCDKMELYGDITKEGKAKKQQSGPSEKKGSVFGKLFGAFSRKKKSDGDVGDIEEDGGFSGDAQ